MGNYQAYEKYKDSGVEWLGKIPEHWEAKRLKFISKKIQTGTTPPTNEEEYYQDGDINWFSPSDFSEGQIHLREAKKKLNRLVLVRKIVKLIPKGSILIIGIGATLGKVGLLDIDATTNQQINAVLLDSKDNSKFVAYFLLVSQEIMKVISNATTLGILNQDKTKQIPLTLPPLDEQEMIANFLDLKTKQIDDLIAKKETLLAKLDEKRSAIISHAVTKGLDPTVPMKDSKVEWLGDIPKHWGVIPVKFSLSMPITDGPHETPEIFDDGIPFISAESVKNDELNFDKKRGYISLEEHKRFSKKYKPKYGDVYMVKSGATTGNVARVKTYQEFNIWSPLAVLRPDPEKSTTDFLFFVIKSKPFFYSVEQSWSFGTQQNIGMGVISNIRIAFPPLDEQQSIANFLDKKTVEIDLQKAKVQEAIERLKEYRTALITNAVTGKIDVRQVSLN